MCGFLGSINFETTKKIFDTSLDKIIHRGKDQTRTVKLTEQNIILGFNRLSILDLSKDAMQPFTNGQEKVFLLYNGEIYNFKELKKDLESLSIVFKTNCDVEVLFNCYLQWGLDKTLEKIKGMYSFFILDTNISKSYLCVDKIGIKPLYYSYSQNKLLFSSESKSINYLVNSCKIEKLQAKKELFFGNSFEQKTIFKNINQLPSGSYIEFDYKKNIFNLIKYFELNSLIKKNKFNELKKSKDIIQKYDDVLSETIKKHCQSDVPVGIMYSGGIDSALIAAIANKYLDYKVPLFFFDSKYNSHYDYAKLINSENKFELIKVDENHIDYIKQMVDTAYYFEKPNKIEALPLQQVSYEASKKGIKVLLSGDGADEIFGGYEFHLDFFQKKNFYENKFVQNIYKALRRFSKFNIFNFQDSDPIKNEYLFQPLRFESLEIFFNILLERPKRIQEWKENLKSYSFINDKIESSNLSFILDSFKSRIHLYNHRSDRIGMSNGVEIRVPYLYDDFVDLALNTELKYKIKNNLLARPQQKYILKLLAKKNKLPNKIINRKKVGTEFNISDLLIKITDKLEFKFCEEIFSIGERDLKKNLKLSLDDQKYVYMYSFIIFEFVCKLFIENMSRDNLYDYLNKKLGT